MFSFVILKRESSQKKQKPVSASKQHWIELAGQVGTANGEAPYFYGSILLRALEYKILVVLTCVYTTKIMCIEV